MTNDTTTIDQLEPPSAPSEIGKTEVVRKLASFLPTWPLITTRMLELRRRRGLMIAVVLLIFGLPIILMGLRLLFHAVDPKSYGPAGSPSTFVGLTDAMASFGFIAAATLGATAGVSDLTEGVFRHLVVTGRSRLSLYLARIPAGLSIVIPLVAVAFTLVCLVTCLEGSSQPTALSQNGVSLPTQLTEPQLETILLKHPNDIQAIYGGGPTFVGPGQSIQRISKNGQGPGPGSNGTVVVSPKYIEKKMPTIYAAYLSTEYGEINPPINQMAKIGLWIVLVLGVGFMVGLGLAVLIAQRTVTIVLMVAVDLIITPLLSSHVIPYFINGQRAFVGVAVDQLRPAYINLPQIGIGGPGHRIVGMGGTIPPMAEWAMILCIVGWIVGWTLIGARKMVTRDA